MRTTHHREGARAIGSPVTPSLRHSTPKSHHPTAAKSGDAALHLLCLAATERTTPQPPVPLPLPAASPILSSHPSHGPHPLSQPLTHPQPQPQPQPHLHSHPHPHAHPHPHLHPSHQPPFVHQMAAMPHIHHPHAPPPPPPHPHHLALHPHAHPHPHHVSLYIAPPPYATLQTPMPPKTSVHPHHHPHPHPHPPPQFVYHPHPHAMPHLVPHAMSQPHPHLVHHPVAYSPRSQSQPRTSVQPTRTLLTCPPNSRPQPPPVRNLMHKLARSPSPPPSTAPSQPSSSSLPIPVPLPLPLPLPSKSTASHLSTPRSSSSTPSPSLTQPTANHPYALQMRLPVSVPVPVSMPVPLSMPVSVPVSVPVAVPVRKVKGPWRPEEDGVLTDLVARLGPRRWTIIASHIPGRTGKQARERYLNQLSPNLARRAWTGEEDGIVMEAHARLGNRWSEIAKLLSGRTDNATKNRFNTTIRRQMSEFSTHAREGVVGNATASATQNSGMGVAGGASNGTNGTGHKNESTDGLEDGLPSSGLTSVDSIGSSAVEGDKSSKTAGKKRKREDVGEDVRDNVDHGDGKATQLTESTLERPCQRRKALTAAC